VGTRRCSFRGPHALLGGPRDVSIRSPFTSLWVRAPKRYRRVPRRRAHAVGLGSKSSLKEGQPGENAGRRVCAWRHRSGRGAGRCAPTPAAIPIASLQFVSTVDGIEFAGKKSGSPVGLLHEPCSLFRERSFNSFSVGKPLRRHGFSRRTQIIPETAPRSRIASPRSPQLLFPARISYLTGHYGGQFLGTGCRNKWEALSLLWTDAAEGRRRWSVRADARRDSHRTPTSIPIAPLHRRAGPNGQRPEVNPIASKHCLTTSFLPSV
jgi:hypothetical protein